MKDSCRKQYRFSRAVNGSRPNGREPALEGQPYVFDKLWKVVDAEYTAASCFNYISGLIKNGRISVRFVDFAKKAEKNKKMFSALLGERGKKNVVFENTCELCKLTPQSFSLLGALNLGIELTRISEDLYARLSEEFLPMAYKDVFKRLSEEKHRQRNFLRKELRFVEATGGSDFIMDVCIPYVVGKFSE